MLKESKRVNLLTLQGTSFCNLDCKYCYIDLETRSAPGRMTLQTVRAVIKRLQEDALLGEHLAVSWHSGEPLVLNARYYDERMREFEVLRAGGVKVQHSLQTNGVLLNDAHCDLFCRYNVQVGLSVDGPGYLHDLNRVDRQGRPTHRNVVQAMQRLDAHGVKFGVICVLGAQSLKCPDEVYEFFLSTGCRSMAFNLEEIEGANVSSSLTPDNAHELFLSFVQRFWLRLEQDRHPFRVREFENTAQLIMSTERWLNSQTEPLSNINVAVNGDWSTFCPELLDHSTADFPTFVFGNVHDRGFREAMETNPIYSLVHDQIVTGVNACRDSCKYFDVCLGGNPSNKLAETGSFCSTQTLACSARTQLVAEFMISRLQEYTAPSVQAGFPS